MKKWGILESSSRLSIVFCKEFGWNLLKWGENYFNEVGVMYNSNEK